ncbi:MAG: hypothetical protein R3321_13445, partial [Nitrososphaeraceae archaeon]|nr:hypothetical protein [Nitrososphaeraceae archaeon]
GAIGDYAVRKHFGLSLKLPESPHYKGTGGTKVRASKHKNGKLPGHRDDKKDKIYIFATREENSNVCKIIGWAWGYEIQKEENWGDHFNKGRPCYALPQYKLNDIRLLVRKTDGKIGLIERQKELF